MDMIVDLCVLNILLCIKSTMSDFAHSDMCDISYDVSEVRHMKLRQIRS